MAARIDGWNNWTGVSADQSRHLRRQGQQQARDQIRSATKRQVKASIKQTKAALSLTKSTNTNPLSAKQTLPARLQVLIPSSRGKDRTDMRQAAAEAGSKHFVQSKQAAHKLGKLQHSSAKPAHSQANDAKAVVTKSHTGETQARAKGQELPQTAVAGKQHSGEKTAPRAKAAVAKGAKRGAKGKVVKDNKLAKTVKPEAKLPKGTEGARRASVAGTAAAVKGHKGIADGSTRTEKKDGEKKEKKSSLTTNAGKAHSKKLGKLLDGGGSEMSTDVTAKDTEWQVDDSDAIGTPDKQERASLMDENAKAVTFNEPSQHDAVWNRNVTFRNEVLKPNKRLEEIADLNSKLGERLAEVALSDKVVMSAAKDPQLKELLLSCMHRRTNAYGGLSG